jgi:hypothetical protein
MNGLGVVLFAIVAGVAAVRFVRRTVQGLRRKRKARDRAKLQQRLDEIVRAATDNVAVSVSGEAPALLQHFFYGSSAVHPRFLAMWYMFRSDADLALARENGLAARLEARTREQLRERGYPADGVRDSAISFATDETIQREAGGSYYHYFQ